MVPAGLDRQPPVRLVEVFATLSNPEMEIVKGLLESDGIPVVVKGMSQGPYRMGPSTLFVPEDLEAQALAIIQDAREDGVELQHEWSGGDGGR